MTWLLPLDYLLSVTATVLAWVVARREPEHRSAAYLLTVGLVVDLARRFLTSVIIRPAAAHFGGAPFTGWARVAAHIDVALFLAWPASLTAFAVWIFLRRRPFGVAVAWALAVSAISVAYPVTRGAVLGNCYLGAHLAALILALGCFLSWLPRGESLVLRQRMALYIIATEGVALVGPWREGPFAHWHLAQVIYATLYAMLILLQGGSLWVRPSSTS
jgi:hypothetical protein